MKITRGHLHLYTFAAADMSKLIELAKRFKFKYACTGKYYQVCIHFLKRRFCSEIWKSKTDFIIKWLNMKIFENIYSQKKIFLLLSFLQHKLETCS